MFEALTTATCLESADGTDWAAPTRTSSTLYNMWDGLKSWECHEHKGKLLRRPDSRMGLNKNRDNVSSISQNITSKNQSIGFCTSDYKQSSDRGPPTYSPRPKTSKSPRLSEFVAGLTEGSGTKGQGPWSQAYGTAELFPHGRCLAVAFRTATAVAAWMILNVDGGCWYDEWWYTGSIWIV